MTGKGTRSTVAVKGKTFRKKKTFHWKGKKKQKKSRCRPARGAARKFPPGAPHLRENIIFHDREGDIASRKKRKCQGR